MSSKCFYLDLFLQSEFFEVSINIGVHTINPCKICVSGFLYELDVFDMQESIA